MRRGWLAALILLSLALPAHAALPPRPGGQLTLPAPEVVAVLDPIRAHTHFEATLVRAVFDGLYEVRESGVIEPVLADGPAVVNGTVARIRLRDGVRHHGSRELTARSVARSLSRARLSPDSAWLLGAFASAGGRLAVREVDARTIELELARPGVNVEAILAAAPLSIVVGGDLAQAPLGTGPYRARLDRHGGVELAHFRNAPDGPPWLNRVRFVAPTSREDEVRAFELGRIDGSWWARSLYGGQPLRPLDTATASTTAPVLLVPNRARALRSEGAWGAVASLVDRARLERVGLAPETSLGAGLPPPEAPRAAAISGNLRLRMLVRAEHALEGRIAEALAGLLDERGVRLSVERASSSAYDAAVSRGDWDLRLAIVRAPFPGQGGLVGAALAAAGQLDRARRIALALDDRDANAAAARSLGSVVLGHERVVLHHRADIVGARFDELGRLPLADLSMARPENE
jgi:MarR-like DNA-binding transcriptional regulator SgrR of sgrS sRNA